MAPPWDQPSRILGNDVEDNPFDCGITLASHPLFGAGPTAAGVFHNTIAGNNSQRNGFQVPGAGAGMGLFSPAPFTKTYGNVVVSNDLTDNGLPGVAMHAHAPGVLLSDNMIVGNRISGNGADTEEMATPGQTGINVSGGDDGTGVPVAVIAGTVIAGIVIKQETTGVATKTEALTAVHLNDFISVTTVVDNSARMRSGQRNQCSFHAVLDLALLTCRACPPSGSVRSESFWDSLAMPLTADLHRNRSRNPGFNAETASSFPICRAIGHWQGYR